MTPKQILAKQKRDTDDLIALRYIERHGLDTTFYEGYWSVGRNGCIPAAKSISWALRCYQNYIEES